MCHSMTRNMRQKSTDNYNAVLKCMHDLKGVTVDDPQVQIMNSFLIEDACKSYPAQSQFGDTVVPTIVTFCTQLLKGNVTWRTVLNLAVIRRLI